VIPSETLLDELDQFGVGIAGREKTVHGDLAVHLARSNERRELDLTEVDTETLRHEVAVAERRPPVLEVMAAVPLPAVLAGEESFGVLLVVVDPIERTRSLDP